MKSGGRTRPILVKCGSVVVRIYSITRKSGILAGRSFFQVADHSSGKRVLRSFADLGEAKSEADRIARQIASGEVAAAQLRASDRASYVRALELLEPTGIALETAAAAFAEAVKVLGGNRIVEAARYLAARSKAVHRKPVTDVVSDLLKLKESRGASPRYRSDLKSRLTRFAADFQKDALDVTTADVQSWLDGQKLSSQSYTNNKRVIHLLFEHAVARGFASDNPVDGVEAVKVKAGETEVFTPAEILKLLNAAPVDFRPCLAIGAFAGLRSAEIERIQWSDIRLSEKCIVVGASRSKTAARRVVPICDNLAAWLAPHASAEGAVWKASHEAFYIAQQETANAAGVKWKPNGLRHSFASYRFAITGDAGRVAGELGNSAQVVHRHYRELVSRADAEKWFAIMPEVKP